MNRLHIAAQFPSDLFERYSVFLTLLRSLNPLAIGLGATGTGAVHAASAPGVVVGDLEPLVARLARAVVFVPIYGLGKLQPQRWEFMFVAAPIRIPGGSGAPVNPIAIF